MRYALALLAGAAVFFVATRITQGESLDCEALTRKLGHHPASLEIDGVCINGGRH